MYIYKVCGQTTGLTAEVPALGGFTTPSIIAFQISSPGISSSIHGIVINGESHRTIEDGSSYLIIKFSSLKKELRIVFNKHDAAVNLIAT